MILAGNDYIWSPDNAFFNTERANTILFENDVEITWKFKRYGNSLFRYPFFECSMYGLGKRAIGYGVDQYANLAVLKAFAEAWERLVFNVCAKPILSTNGLAAGSTDSDAIQRSKAELIERAVFLKAWRDKEGWRNCTTTKCLNRFEIWAYGTQGWKLSFFDIVSNLGVVKACLATNKKLGCIFDTAFSADENLATKKVFFSVVKDIHLHVVWPKFDLSEEGTPLDHKKFYSDYRNASAFEFLYESKFGNSAIGLDMEGLTSEVLYSAHELPAVAVSENKSWGTLNWGAQSIEGINKWPHPLA